MRHKLCRLLTAILLLTSAIDADARVYLVSVGVADYPGSDNDLRLSAKDAETIAWLYQKNGDVEYSLLTDGKATLRKVKAAMRVLYARAGKDDTVLFFFSGHGYKGGFAVYDGYLDYATVRKAMAKGRCRNKVIFADACFSGKMRGGKKPKEQPMKRQDETNVMLFLSSRANEYSIERPNMKNGFFTHFLQQALRGGADANKDRVITADEMYRYVHDEVIKLSDGRQHPQVWGRFDGDMPVMKW